MQYQTNYSTRLKVTYYKYKYYITKRVVTHFKRYKVKQYSQTVQFSKRVEPIKRTRISLFTNKRHTTDRQIRHIPNLTNRSLHGLLSTRHFYWLLDSGSLSGHIQKIQSPGKGLLHCIKTQGWDLITPWWVTNISGTQSA